MTALFYVIIHDTWPECPGTIKLGPFGSRPEAQARLDKELAHVDETYSTGSAAQFWGKIEEVRA